MPSAVTLRDDYSAEAKLGFSPVSARPRHPRRDARVVEAFKKLRGDPERHLPVPPRGAPIEIWLPMWTAPSSQDFRAVI